MQLHFLGSAVDDCLLTGANLQLICCGAHALSISSSIPVTLDSVKLLLLLHQCIGFKNEQVAWGIMMHATGHHGS